MLQYVATFLLYSFSIGFSFLFTGLFIKNLTLKELEEDAEEDRLALKRLEEENFEYKYLDEYEQLEEKPFLHVTIIMFYEDGIFKYYSNTDVVYKYLNVACRKFVIENDAKKIYIVGKEDIIPEIKMKEKEKESNLFVTKPETVLFETKMNKFIRVGSIYDYNDKNNIKLIKEIDILDFLQNNFDNCDNISNKRFKSS